MLCHALHTLVSRSFVPAADEKNICFGWCRASSKPPTDLNRVSPTSWTTLDGFPMPGTPDL